MKRLIWPQCCCCFLVGFFFSFISSVHVSFVDVSLAGCVGLTRVVKTHTHWRENYKRACHRFTYMHKHCFSLPLLFICDFHTLFFLHTHTHTQTRHTLVFHNFQLVSGFWVRVKSIECVCVCLHVYEQWYDGNASFIITSVARRKLHLISQTTCKHWG